MSVDRAPTATQEHQGFTGGTNDDRHLPDECTYVCPNTDDEVLAFRDERHVVVDSDTYRLLQDVYMLAEASPELNGEVRRLIAAATDRKRSTHKGES